MHESSVGLYGLQLASSTRPTGCPLVKYLNRRNVKLLALARRPASDVPGEGNMSDRVKPIHMA